MEPKWDKGDGTLHTYQGGRCSYLTYMHEPDIHNGCKTNALLRAQACYVNVQ